MNPEIDKLVQRAQCGDNAAAASLIGLHYERIYAFLRRLSGSDAEAADLTQRTFARVWQGLSGFAGRSSFASWVHGIAHHVYVDWRRSNHRTEQRSQEWWACCLDPQARPDQLAADQDLAAYLYASVDALPEEWRHAIHLHYYQGLTLEETANAQNVATSTVKYRLRQALAELGRKVEPQTFSL